MRDRLIELLTETFDEQYNKRMLITPQHTADYLLANGVIVPPCKVGDTVYSYSGDFGVVLPYFVENLTIAYLEENKFCYTYEANCNNDDELLDSIDFNCEDFGKTVFLTRVEAEQKLKEE